MKRYAIVGFGCAGYHALCAIREHDTESEIHIFSDHNDPPSNPMLTTYFVANRLPYKGMFPFGTLEEIQKRFNAVIHVNTQVTHLDAARKSLRFLEAGKDEERSFDAVLLATGATPIVPPLGVEVGKRVLCMRTVQDAELLKERLDVGDIRSATVIGGSMVGIKIIELLQEREIACTLADMAERIFPLSAFPDVSEEIERRLSLQKIALRFGSAVTGAKEDESSVTTSFADGTSVTGDLLVLCIGTRANITLAKDAGIETGRGIVVDDRMMSSVEGIYAAGDCCEARNLMDNSHQVIGLWANAGYQGETAGACMSGKCALFSGNIIHNITHFMGMDFISLGNVNAEGEIHTIGKPSDSRYIKAVRKDGQLLCLNLLEGYHISGVLKNYMMNRFSGNRAPLPTALRGLLAREGFTDEFLSLFEGEEHS